MPFVLTNYNMYFFTYVFGLCLLWEVIFW